MDIWFFSKTRRPAGYCKTVLFSYFLIYFQFNINMINIIQMYIIFQYLLYILIRLILCNIVLYFASYSSISFWIGMATVMLVSLGMIILFNRIHCTKTDDRLSALEMNEQSLTSSIVTIQHKLLTWNQQHQCVKPGKQTRSWDQHRVSFY